MTIEELPHVYELLRTASRGILDKISISNDDQLILPINNAINVQALKDKLLEIDNNLQRLHHATDDVTFIDYDINYIIINLLLQDNMMDWMSNLCDDKNQNDYSNRNAANQAMQVENPDRNVGIGSYVDKDTGKTLQYFYDTSAGRNKKIPGHAVNVVGYVKERGKIEYLKIRGSWEKCDTRDGYVLIAWQGIQNHLYNVIIAEDDIVIGGMMTKRKRKRKTTLRKMYKTSKSKRKQTRRL
jgi:hypothetical protein